MADDPIIAYEAELREAQLTSNVAALDRLIDRKAGLAPLALDMGRKPVATLVA